MIKPNQLRVFVAIADAGSLASAAVELHRTQPAVSKTLRELEESLGLQLFNRTAAGMTLTEAGAVLLPRSRAVLEELERSEQEMAMLRGKVGGRLRVGTSPIGAMVITRAVFQFRKRMPAIELELYDHAAPTLHELVTAGGIDVAICSVPSYSQPPSGVHSTLLTSLPMSLATHRKGAYGAASSLADLRDATWIYVDPTGAQRQFVADRFVEQGMEPPVASILCTSAMMVLMLASEFDAVLLLSRDLINIYNRELVELPVLTTTPYLHMYSFLRPGGITTHATNIFLDCVTNTLSEPVPIYGKTRFLLGH